MSAMLGILELIFFGGVLATWLYFMARYIGPSKRSFVRYTERDVSRQEWHSPTARACAFTSSSFTPWARCLSGRWLR